MNRIWLRRRVMKSQLKMPKYNSDVVPIPPFQIIVLFGLISLIKILR
jgi:hypothetical protein